MLGLIQIVSTPDLQIIHFPYGHTGSMHNATAWAQTRLTREHNTLLTEGEWVWVDSAYPASKSLWVPHDNSCLMSNQIQTWVVAPYRAPERSHPNNAMFNEHVSKLCIRSEHAIGFLKGQFPSLKGLWVQINYANMH